MWQKSLHICQGCQRNVKVELRPTSKAATLGQTIIRSTLTGPQEKLDHPVAYSLQAAQLPSVSYWCRDDQLLDKWEGLYTWMKVRSDGAY